MKIRLIQLADNEAVQALIKKTLEQENLAIAGSAYFDPQLAKLYQYYSQWDQAAYFVGIQDGQIVGGIGIAPYSEGVGELQKLYVSASARRIGLGSQLMDKVLDFAETYYQAIYLETSTKLNNAIRLYERYGFKLLDSPLPGTNHSAMDAWYIKYL